MRATVSLLDAPGHTSRPAKRLSGHLLDLGELQVDVLQHRRENEYGVVTVLTRKGFTRARWLRNVTQAWVGSGRHSLGASLLVLHGGVFVLALALLWWRDHAAVLHFRRGDRREASA